METTYPSWGKDLESSFEIFIGLGVREHQQFQSLALHDKCQPSSMSNALPILNSTLHFL